MTPAGAGSGRRSGLLLAALARAPRVPPAPALLEAALDALIAAARAAWPQVNVGDDVFLTAVARRLPAGDDLLAALQATHATDLYLTCAAAQGQREAITALETAYAPDLRRAAARARAMGLQESDFLQELREKLFVTRADAPPGITTYSGRGGLRGWLRVAASRTLLDLLDRHRISSAAVQPVEDRALDAVASPADDPELGHIKRTLRGAFQEALKGAYDDLSPQDRELLHRHYVDGWGIDALGLALGVHRSNAARQLGKARRALLSLTRRALTRDLGVIGGDIDSMVRLVKSDLDVSLHALLDVDEPK